MYIPPLRPLLSKIVNGIRDKFSFVLVLIVTAGLGSILGCIEDLSIKITYIAIIVIIAAIILVIIYFFELIEIGNRLGIYQYVPQDISIQFLKREIIFDEDTCRGIEYEKANGETKIYHCAKGSYRRIIQNKMNNPYAFFRFNVNSSKYVPKDEGVDFFVNGTQISVAGMTNEPPFYHKYAYHSGGNEIHKSVEKQFNIPVHIPPKDFCDLSMSYRTLAYERAREGLPDHYELKVNYLTEKIVIDIKMDGIFRNHYKFLIVNEFDECSGSRKTFQIRDESDQRMRGSERDLAEMKMIPNYSDYRIKWVVYKPKLGYRYRIYFTMQTK